MADVAFGSWLCKNAATRMRRDYEDAHLDRACESSIYRRRSPVALSSNWIESRNVLARSRRRYDWRFRCGKSIMVRRWLSSMIVPKRVIASSSRVVVN